MPPAVPDHPLPPRFLDSPAVLRLFVRNTRAQIAEERHRRGRRVAERPAAASDGWMMSEVGAQIDDGELSDADLYARHAAELVRFATVLVGPSGADDLVADVVARVVAHPGWPSVRERRAYLYRAVLNEARQHERSRTRRRRREQRAAAHDRVDAPDVRPEVLAAVQTLGPRQRAIVFFTYWQDRATADIAAELGITARTVQRELADARRKLEEALR